MDGPTSGALRIGMLGGAFDPPHRAHVALANAALEQLALDRLHIVPTGQAWHKARALTDAAHRLEMCGLAFGTLERTVIDARELHRQGPTYTVDTLLELHVQYPGAQLFLVMGADQARALPGWSRVNEVVRLAIICVAERDDSGLQTHMPAVAGLQPDRLQWLQLPTSPISATTIRQQLADKQDIRTLVPESVARYIDQHHLYQTA